MPKVDIRFFNIVVHHFFFGVILATIGFLTSKQKSHKKIILYAVGIGLIIDQLVFMLLGAGKDKEYWALPSLLSVFIIAFSVFLIRQKLTNFLLEKTPQFIAHSH